MQAVHVAQKKAFNAASSRSSRHITFISIMMYIFNSIEKSGDDIHVPNYGSSVKRRFLPASNEQEQLKGVMLLAIAILIKFGRRLHFALRRKILKSQIAHLPAI